MLLMELKRVKEPTFAGYDFDDASKNALAKLSDGLPNSTSKEDLHVTLIYSKKPIIMMSHGRLANPIAVKVKSYSIFTTDKAENCLVLELDAPEVVARHNQIMEETGASYDYPVYRPHVTLSYDVGPDFDISTLPEVSTLPTLHLIREYARRLNPNWATKAAA